MFLKRKNRGFTLVELMIVIAIIGILVAVLYPSITGYFSRARDTQKKGELNQLNLALQMYYYDNGTYKIPDVGLSNNGYGWVNFAHSNSSAAYKKSIVTGLQENGYLSKNIKTIKRDWAGIPSSLRQNTPCATPALGIDLYMLYFDDTSGQYSLSATLENPTTKDLEHIQTLYNHSGPQGICSKYGKNYGIGN